MTTWESPTSLDEKLLKFGEEFKDVVMEMRKYKSENNLSMKTELESLTVTGSAEFEGFFKETEKDLIACSSAKQIVYDLK